MSERNSIHGKIPIIYLDYNCFQRVFDDPNNMRIQLEAIACQAMFALAEDNHIRLVWSFMHQDESEMCPFAGRKMAALQLSSLCSIKIIDSESIRNLAQEFIEKVNIDPQDSVHLACAVESGAEYFLTCDETFLKRAQKLLLGLEVLNPLDYINREVRKYEP